MLKSYHCLLFKASRIVGSDILKYLKKLSGGLKKSHNEICYRLLRKPTILLKQEKRDHEPGDNGR